MKSRNAETFKAGAAPFLEEGEVVLGAMVAQPQSRRRPVAAGGLIASEIAVRTQRGARFGAEAAGLVVDAPMALVITQRRLLTLQIGTPVLGRGGAVKRLMSAVPLTDVDAFEVRGVGLAKQITVTIRGIDVELEGAAGANQLEDAYEQAKVAA